LHGPDLGRGLSETKEGLWRSIGAWNSSLVWPWLDSGLLWGSRMGSPQVGGNRVIRVVQGAGRGSLGGAGGITGGGGSPKVGGNRVIRVVQGAGRGSLGGAGGITGGGSLGGAGGIAVAGVGSLVEPEWTMGFGMSRCRWATGGCWEPH